MTIGDLEELHDTGHAMPGVLAFFTYLYVTECRRRYAEEREYPEFVDLGGES